MTPEYCCHITAVLSKEPGILGRSNEFLDGDTDVTFVQLRTFLAVLRHGGFTAAARALLLSQTTITSQIQALESEHGTELFHRRGRRVELTSAGEELLPLARQIVGLEDEARLLLEDNGALRRGHFRIGAASPYHVIDMIASFHRRHPQVHLTMTLGNSDLVLKALERYACDVGVVAKATEDERYETLPYGTFPVIAFLHRDHPLATRRGITLAELAAQPMLMREPGSTTRLAMEEAFAIAGLTPNIAMEIGSREALREVVARGFGVGTVSQSDYVADPRLKPMPITDAAVVTHIHICCLRERRRSRVVASFFDAIDRPSLKPEAGKG
jgi:LysR family transcriptional regulator, low CO2-responsive transcriptional regulator